MKNVQPKILCRILLAGGGTGGHLYPALAIGEKILEKRPECEIQFVGTIGGIENKIIPAKGFVLHLLAVRGIKRKLTLQNFLVPFRLFWSFVQCIKILKESKPVAVIGTGGYVSGPMLFMASLLKFPTVIQEQNSYPGITTKLLAKRVNVVHLSFADSMKYFKRKDNLRITGNPVRAFNTNLGPQKAKEQFGLDKTKFTLFVFGGSQGAMAINNAMITILENLMKKTTVQILWSAGKNNLKNVEQAVLNYADRVKVFEFIDDIDSAYAATDLAICRAGAMTLAEITLCGIPSILIPYPYAAENHQEANARSLEKSGAAKVLIEKDLDEQTLLNEISNLLNDDQKREQMSTAAIKNAFPNATEEIVKTVFEIVRQ
jgi:UDP-N-acetylglucosamine--N-acetylmuramyl-(pentapeptide) pyrophosphoryl-undecaprenol N-acetylglucosamine transferase